MGRDRTCSKAMCPERAASYKSFASRAFPGRTRLSTASTNQRSAPAAERKKRGRTGGPALVCPQRAPTKGVRRQQKGRKKAGRAGRDRASALKTVPCRCWSAFPGRTRLPTASANQRSAPAADRKKKGRTGGPLRGSWYHTRSACERGRPACPCPCAPASVTVCLSLVFLPLGLLRVLPTAAAPPRPGAERHF